jgi:hypothetical protein
MAMGAALLLGCGLDAAGHAEPVGTWGDDGSVDHATPVDARADATGDAASDVVQDVAVEETPVCTPGGTQCSGNGVQTCDSNGQWGGVSPCTGQTCVNGACQGVCAPGDMQSVGCGNCGTQMDTCGSDGNWVQGTCGGQGVCATGALRCGGGNQPQLCNSMCQWANSGPACAGGIPCMNGKCVCGTTTCTGCCASDNTCQPGTTNTACGVAGVGCVDCTATSQHCTGSGFCN